VENLALPSRKSRRAKKLAKTAATKSCEDSAVDEAAAVTETVVNLVVSVPVVVSGRDLVTDDGSLITKGPVVDANVVPTLNGMEVCFLNGVGVPSLNAGTYKLLVGEASDCTGGPVFMPNETDAVNLASSAMTSSVV